MKHPTVRIIIVNWNAGKHLYNCISSIVESNLNGICLSDVVIVDNASTDDSMINIEKIGLPLTIIRNCENRGFAAACNQGAQGNKADYLLFLNPDTRLLCDSLEKPVIFMEKKENSKIGITGIQLIGDYNEVAPTCARFPTSTSFFYKMFGLNRLFPEIFPSHYMVEWNHGDNREVDQVMGAFFLVRRCLFETLGGFDERFFVYFEEVDFSLRARQAGWRSFYLAETQIYHKGGGTSEQIKAIRMFYSLRSRILYGYKHFSWSSATCLLLGSIFLEPIARVTLAISRCSWEELVETLKGFAVFWLAVPSILKIAWFKGDTHENTHP